MSETSATVPDQAAGATKGSSGTSGQADNRQRSRWRGSATIVAVLLLLPVVVVTVLRIFDIPGGFGDTVVSFTPYAIIGASLSGILAVLGRSLLVGISCGALFLVHGFWLAPMYLSDGPTVRGYSTTVMSINLGYGNGDRQQVVDLVRERDVELLSVQELTPKAVAGFERAGLDKFLPHRTIEPAAGSPNGTGIWSSHPLEPSEFGNQQRMAFENLRATVTTRGGVKVDMLAVHPFPPLPSTSEPWRRDIGELIRVGVPEDRPMIMAGDFNGTRDHAPMRKLAEQGLADAADQAGAGYGPTWGPIDALPQLFEIDHVLVSDDDVHASMFTRHVIDGTDHNAVLAELTISEETSNEQ